MRAEVSQYEDQEAIREEYNQAGANYDILAGEKVHELSDDVFQHNVGILKQVLSRRRQTNFDFE